MAATAKSSKSTKRLTARTDKLLGRKTPKKKTTTTAVIMDSADLQTLKTVAHWRVISGNADTASVSELVREAVAEYIERHHLHTQEYAANNADRLGSAH